MHDIVWNESVVMLVSEITLHSVREEIVKVKYLSINPEYIQWLNHHRDVLGILWSCGKWYVSNRHSDSDKYMKELKSAMDEHLQDI